jgi:microcystin-dependent protein
MPYGCGPVKFNPRGEWDSGTAYGAYDVVTRSGSSYWAKMTPNVGNDPEVNSPDQWQLLARKGDTGEQGTQGDPGADGATWHSGSGSPSGELGGDGDHYLDTDSGDVYQKSEGSWNHTGNIKGPQGDQGEQGEPGQDTAVPVGTIMDFAGLADQVPDKWMPCRGQSLSSSEYPDLWNAIGDTWGGDGEPYFQLPNLRNRIRWGENDCADAGEVRSVGSTGGGETATLGEDNLPEHSHGLSYPDGSTYVTDVSGCTTSRCEGTDNSFSYVDSVSQNTGSLPSSTENAGQSSPDPVDILPPYAVVIPIIRVLP